MTGAVPAVLVLRAFDVYVLWIRVCRRARARPGRDPRPHARARGEGTADEMQIRLTVLGPRGGRRSRLRRAHHRPRGHGAGHGRRARWPPPPAPGSPAAASTGAAGGALRGHRPARRPPRSSACRRWWTARCCPCTPPPSSTATTGSTAASGSTAAARRPRRAARGGRARTRAACTCSRAARPGSAARRTRTCRSTTRTSPGCTARSRSAPDGEVTVADLGSTNGTTLSGHPVGPRPVPFPPGALLRIGESTLRLDPAAHQRARPRWPPARTRDGHLRVSRPSGGCAAPDRRAAGRPYAAGADDPAGRRGADRPDERPWPAVRRACGPRRGTVRGPRRVGAAAGDPRRPAAGRPAGLRTPPRQPHRARRGQHRRRRRPGDARARLRPAGRGAAAPPASGPGAGSASRPRGRGLVGAIGAWARRLASGRRPAAGRRGARQRGGGRRCGERWPDPAAVLLTALGPGRRLWERGPGHPDALTVRLGTADLPAQDGARLLAACPTPWTCARRGRRR